MSGLKRERIGIFHASDFGGLRFLFGDAGSVKKLRSSEALSNWHRIPKYIIPTT